jgi:hypothetical protein
VIQPQVEPNVFETCFTKHTSSALPSLSLSPPFTPHPSRPPPPLFPASGAALRQRSVGPSPGLGGALLRRRASHGYAVPYPCLLPPSLPAVRNRSPQTRPDPRRPPAMKNPLLFLSLSVVAGDRPRVMRIVAIL